jgi:nucleotide-binding universal stress UspA family protein
MNYASEEGVSLIAMATHGRSGFDRLVMGSVVERVLRSVAVPVLLLRPEAAAVARTAGERLALALGQGGGLRIAVATDGATFGQRAVTLASQLQQLLGGELTVLVTASDREGAGKAQQTMTDTTALLLSTGAGEMRPRAIVPLVGYADEEVLHSLQANPVDLLVIGAFADRGAGGANVVGPTAYRILQEVQSTVLLVKGHRQLFRRVLVCAGVEDEALVTVGAQFAQILGAQLDLLHVMPPSAAPYLSTEPGATMDVEAAIAQGTRLSAMLHKWEDKLEAHGFTRSSIVLQPGSVQEVILQRARDTGYDLVVAGSESTPGHFPSSIANTLVRYVDQSVLLVRTRTR